MEPSDKHSHKKSQRGQSQNLCEASFVATDAPPGSAEKLAVLRERAERGLDLHHPDDNKTLVIDPTEAARKRGLLNENSASGRKLKAARSKKSAKAQTPSAAPLIQSDSDILLHSTPIAPPL
jgi:hypothetical protein